MSQYPARTWAELGRPACGRWMGWANGDQPYLVGMRVEFLDVGGLVQAQFADGDCIRFDPGTPFRFAALEVTGGH